MGCTLNKQYDFHIATDQGADSGHLRSRLLELGFVDDQLVHRGLTFPREVAVLYEACPLIDIHMSIKTDSFCQQQRIQEEVLRAVATTSCAGYWHAEWTKWDARVEPTRSKLRICKPAFRPLQAWPRQTHKKWDLHISFLEDDISTKLRQELMSAGLYWLTRRKNGKQYAVVTIQGVNPIREGEWLAQQLMWWLTLMGCPAFDLKFEITTAMGTFNNPKLVPPTIDTISWK